MAKELLQKEYAGPNGWTIWAVEGRIDTLTAETAYAFGEELVQKNAKTVLDMQEMDYLSSAGLRCLLRLFKLAKKEGKGAALTGQSADPGRTHPFRRQLH
ncbi:MAG: STAS domain-containing protein [Acidaminococcaceae bacterium]|jgi:anti-anti-sigma factor|nr:STAS domain-containing protein [Acidaminococcaceae bacterium]MBO5604115.1 STAS domain-containing protein [Acidaminococcaceae bacterium]MBP3265223.1 STAS domain-containing protein [Acidaminococcaceae bacterium]MBQ5345548.1 STAS domain-containing protein [Acidaminococcaceae bacterium]MBQ9283650.1 STAS domain-containing protein [Acidaminococcaceae bacterium]